MKSITDKLKYRKNQAIISNNIFDTPPTPIIFSSERQFDFEEKFISFLNKTDVVSVTDTYKQQLEELFYLRNPSITENMEEAKILKINFFKQHKKKVKNFEYCGAWVYYPWTKRLVHFLEEDIYQEIRTARNKLLLTEKEQEKFRRYVVGICGLSIGNSVALSLAYNGGCETMKLADPDIFSASNLNRVRIPAYYIGVKKVYVAAQQIYEINPFAKLILYKDGINSRNLKDFFRGVPRLNAIIDEMDNLKMKIIIRMIAKSEKLPVAMTTDNGDNAIIDVDRFDLKSQPSPFDNLPNLDLETIIKTLRVDKPPSLLPEARVSLSSDVVGVDNIAPRMQQSLMEVGKTLVSWPQLSTAAFLGGAALAYVIKKLALDESVKNGKTHISLDALLLEEYYGSRAVNTRKMITKKFINYIKSHPKVDLKDLLSQ